MAYALDFEADLDGVRVTVDGRPLGPGCLSDDAVDREIARLGADLDRLRTAMKAALREHRAAGEG